MGKITALLFYAVPVETVIGCVTGAVRAKDIYVINP